MNPKASVSINDYEYANNFISAYKEARTYKALNAVNPDLPPLIFKGYPEAYLGDPLKEKKLMLQLNFLWKLRGRPNVVQVLSQHYRDRMIFIITEFCERGDLASEIKTNGAFTEDKAIAYLSQIINGYRSINEAKILHRNLQPSNILISAELEVKIGDFSHAIYLKDSPMATKREEIVGSISYQAPEVLERYSYTQQSDIYSIGLIFLAMLKGKTLFSGENKTEVLSKMKGTSLGSIIGDQFTLKTRHFLMMALKTDPSQRMTIQQMLSYKFQALPKPLLNKFFTFEDISSNLHLNTHINPHNDNDNANTNTDTYSNPLNDNTKTNSNPLNTNSNPLNDNTNPHNDNTNPHNDNTNPHSQHNHRQGSLNTNKQLDSIKQIFGDASPIRTQPKRSINPVDLKASEDYPEQSPSSKDKPISIFIPSKLQAPPSCDQSKSKKDFFKLFAVDSNISVEYEPSFLILPTEKEQSVQSHNTVISKRSRSSIEGMMLMSQVSSRVSSQKHQSESAMKVTLQPFDKSGDGSPGSTEQYTANNNMQTSRQKDCSTLSPIKNNETVIEVNVYSPKRQFLHQASKIVSDEDVIANWLLSQVDMTRFLSRVGYRLNKLAGDGDKDLVEGLFGLRSKMLSQLKSLQILDPKSKSLFRDTKSYYTLSEIIQNYEERYEQSGKLQSNQTLKKMVSQRAVKMFDEISRSTRLSSFSVKTLDSLISCFRLLKLLGMKRLDKFYQQAQLQQLLCKQENQMSFACLLELHGKMKELRILPP